MLPSRLCSHCSLYSTKGQLFARGIIAKKKKKLKCYLVVFFILYLFCFAWLQSVHQQVFGFHVQY